MRVAHYARGIQINFTDTEYRAMGSPDRAKASFNGFNDPSHPLLSVAPDQYGYVVFHDARAANHNYRLFIPAKLVPKGIPLFGVEDVQPVENRATKGFSVPRPPMVRPVVKRGPIRFHKKKVQAAESIDMNTVAQAVATLNSAKRKYGHQFVISLDNGHVSVMFELK